MFLMDSGQREGADFKSNVCQPVSVDSSIFLERHISNMPAKKIKEFSTVSLPALHKALFVRVIK